MSLDLTDWQNKKYQTENGVPIRVLCIDSPGLRQIVGVDNYGSVRKWDLFGKNGCSDQGDSLINATPTPVTITRWVNVGDANGLSLAVDGYTCSFYPTKEAALDYGTHKHLVIAYPLTITFTTNGR